MGKTAKHVWIAHLEASAISPSYSFKNVRERELAQFNTTVIFAKSSAQFPDLEELVKKIERFDHLGYADLTMIFKDSMSRADAIRFKSICDIIFPEASDSWKEGSLTTKNAICSLVVVFEEPERSDENFSICEVI